MKENRFSFSAISLKSTIVHTVSYFVIGILALTFLDYSAKFADPIVANMFRQTDHPLVAQVHSSKSCAAFYLGSSSIFYAS